MKKLLTISGIAFVTAWIAGLMAASNGPKPSATGAALKAYYASHEAASMFQTFCVDALAGVAIIGITIGLSRVFSGRAGRRIRIAGYTAAAVSLVQAAVGETLAAQGAGSGSPALVRALFVTLNNGDTVKIALLAALVIMVSIAARRAAALPRWLTAYGIAFAPIMALSGLAFPLNSNGLYAALYITLPLLLLWTPTISISLGRRTTLA